MQNLIWCLIASTTHKKITALTRCVLQKSQGLTAVHTVGPGQPAQHCSSKQEKMSSLERVISICNRFMHFALPLTHLSLRIHCFDTHGHLLTPTDIDSHPHNPHLALGTHCSDSSVLMLIATCCISLGRLMGNKTSSDHCVFACVCILLLSALHFQKVIGGTHESTGRLTQVQREDLGGST